MVFLFSDPFITAAIIFMLILIAYIGYIVIQINRKNENEKFVKQASITIPLIIGLMTVSAFGAGVKQFTDFNTWAQNEYGVTLPVHKMFFLQNFGVVHIPKTGDIRLMTGNGENQLWTVKFNEVKVDDEVETEIVGVKELPKA